MGVSLTTGGGGNAPQAFEDGIYTLQLERVGDPLDRECTYEQNEQGIPYDQCLKEEQAEWTFRIVGGDSDGLTFKQRITHMREFENTDDEGNVTRLWRPLWSDRSNFGKLVRALLGLPATGKMPSGIKFDTKDYIGKKFRASVIVNPSGYFKLENPRAITSAAPRTAGSAVTIGGSNHEEPPF